MEDGREGLDLVVGATLSRTGSLLAGEGQEREGRRWHQAPAPGLPFPGPAARSARAAEGSGAAVSNLWSPRDLGLRKGCLCPDPAPLARGRGPGTSR